MFVIINYNELEIHLKSLFCHKFLRQTLSAFDVNEAEPIKSVFESSRNQNSRHMLQRFTLQVSLPRGDVAAVDDDE
jgi:hypothetical protein